MQYIRQALTELGEIGGDELVHDVVGMFMTDAPLRLSEVRAAVQAGDTKAAVRAAHSLKSTAAQLGLVKLGAFCATMESTARAGDLGRLSTQLTEAETLRAVAVMQLRNIVGLAA